MAFETVFKRYEYKYLITKEQKQRLVEIMKDYMCPDEYGKTTIRNLYFDTDTYLLIRRSIEKPSYKEKLRIRSYDKAKSDSTVFVELKKKYNSIVYKRRISLPENQAMDWTLRKAPCPKKEQISSEIDYFLGYYQNLRPKIFISYDREAYYSKERHDFRITFDSDILARQTNLSLQEDVFGEPLLPEYSVLMEVKCSYCMPSWLVAFLSDKRIYKTNYSKYGTAYETMIYPEKSIC